MRQNISGIPVFEELADTEALNNFLVNYRLSNVGRFYAQAQYCEEDEVWYFSVSKVIDGNVLFTSDAIFLTRSEVYDFLQGTFFYYEVWQ